MERDFHPVGAIAWAEARGQTPQSVDEVPTLTEVVLAKYQVLSRSASENGSNGSEAVLEGQRVSEEV